MKTRRLAFLAAVCLLVPACSKSSRVRLDQPRLTTSERHLDLMSEQVYWASELKVYRLLAEIPLPGAGTGRPTYLLYLRMHLERDSKGSGWFARDVRGFVIQTRGERRGLTPLIRASVMPRTPASSSHGDWILDVELAFEDGSLMTGRFIARRDDWRLKRFESRTHTADVQGLDNPTPAKPPQSRAP